MSTVPQKKKKEPEEVTWKNIRTSLNLVTCILLFNFLIEMCNIANSFGACVLSHSVMSDCLPSHGLQPARLLCPWNSSGKNTGVGCHALLQGIFPTQGSNPGLLHCRQILYHLSHLGLKQLLFAARSWVALQTGSVVWGSWCVSVG